MTFSILIGAAAAALLLQQPDLDAFHTESSRQLAEPNAPGLALALVADGGVDTVYAAGLADTASGRTVDTEDVFRSASTLKMVVAAAVVRAAMETDTDLHAPIGSIAPDLPAHLHPITLHQLLTHTGGLIDRTDDHGRTDPDALRDAVMELEPDIVFLEPGLAFSYSNIGYNLAGYMLEVMTGDAFTVAMDRLVLTPLGMDRSTFSTRTAIELGRADPHWRGVPLERNPENAAESPSGLMYTSARDQARFMTALMHDGVVEGERVWPAGLSGLLTAPHIPASRTATGFGYGYGVMIGRFGNRPAWFHSGGLPGYRANVLVLPEAGLGAVLLANGEGFDRPALLNALFPPAPAQEEAAPALRPLRAAQPVIGAYVQAPGLPSLCVFEQSGELFIRNRGQDYRLRRQVDDPTWWIGLDSDDEPRTRFRLHRSANGDTLALSSWVRAFRYSGEACA